MEDRVYDPKAIYIISNVIAKAPKTWLSDRGGINTKAASSAQVLIDYLTVSPDTTVVAYFCFLI
jgi:hypothetical protein